MKSAVEVQCPDPIKKQVQHYKETRLTFMDRLIHLDCKVISPLQTIQFGL